MFSLCTLCYIERDNKYLMLHRVVKKHDINHDKWIGVGGHFEADESPEDCLLREVKEETGYTLASWRFRGIVTFISGDGCTEYMHLYTADQWTGEAIPCDEGVLEWVDKKEVWNLELWEGDRIFFRLLDENIPFFSLKLAYNGSGVLRDAVLNGRPMELLDVLNPDGSKTGVVKERGVAHLDGSLHATVHMWLVHRNASGKYEILLQKRSKTKDSHAGEYDISSAGHIDAGEEVLATAQRELLEELGIKALPEEFHYIGMLHHEYREEFYGRPFHDNQLSYIFILHCVEEPEEMHLQEEEVESVRWIEYEKCRKAIADGSIPNCIYPPEFKLLGEKLGVFHEER